jgi:hypothetical protein
METLNPFSTAGVSASEGAPTPGNINLAQIRELLAKIPADKMTAIMDQIDVMRKPELQNYRGYLRVCEANGVTPVDLDTFELDRRAAMLDAGREGASKLLAALPEPVREPLRLAIEQAFARAVSDQAIDPAVLRDQVLSAVCRSLGVPSALISLMRRFVE